MCEKQRRKFRTNNLMFICISVWFSFSRKSIIISILLWWAFNRTLSLSFVVNLQRSHVWLRYFTSFAFQHEIQNPLWYTLFLFVWSIQRLRSFNGNFQHAPYIFPFLFWIARRNLFAKNVSHFGSVFNVIQVECNICLFAWCWPCNIEHIYTKAASQTDSPSPTQSTNNGNNNFIHLNIYILYFALSFLCITHIFRLFRLPVVSVNIYSIFHK